jgi:hypothetical protein
VATRAGVSQRVFQDVFPTVESCYCAAYHEGVGRLSHTVGEAASGKHRWVDRVRAGLVALLGFFDDEPSWARLLIFDLPGDGALTLQCRPQLYELLAGLLEPSGGVQAEAGSPVMAPALMADLVVGGVFSVLRTNLLEDDSGKLVELAPSLMAFIAAPYLGQVAAQDELDGRPSHTDAGLAGAARSRQGNEDARAAAISRAGELPVRGTHRTTLVLQAIADKPYSNNREVAQAAGLGDEGQTSKLLARLQRRGVIENVGIGAARGEPNAWLLTPSGRRAVELLGESFTGSTRRTGGTRTRGVA